MVFSRESALEFLKRNLHIECDSNRLINGNKLTLLNEIIRAFYQYIPFNNFRLLAMDKDARTSPSLEEMHIEVVANRGGMCNTLNAVYKCLLDALGFEASLGWGHILQCQVPDPHHMHVFVENLVNENDIFYTDVGFGFPTFEAVPLNGLPHCYQFAFHHCKIDYDGEKYTRYHKSNAVMGTMKEENDDVWIPFISFTLNKKEFADYTSAMEEIYTSQENSVFLNIIYAAWYPVGRAITVRDLSIRVWDEFTQTVTVLNPETIDEACNIIAKYFMTIDRKTIEKALTSWQENRDNKKDTSCMV